MGQTRKLSGFHLPGRSVRGAGPSSSRPPTNLEIKTKKARLLAPRNSGALTRRHAGSYDQLVHNVSSGIFMQQWMT